MSKVLKNQRVLEVKRRSKYLIIKTAKGHVLIHLGMTGNLLNSKSSKPFKDHTHYVLGVKNNEGDETFYHYVDPRRFGSIHSHLSTDLSGCPQLEKCGVEPLETKNLAGHFYKRAVNKSKPIKNFIMDNINVVGVGNIYATESLFLSGIHPERAAQSLSEVEWKELALNIKKVLKRAIKAGGTSFSDYRHTDGSSGYFQVKLNVYGKHGEPCPKCQTTIELIKQAGRATSYCPSCQR